MLVTVQQTQQTNNISDWRKLNEMVDGGLCLTSKHEGIIPVKSQEEADKLKAKLEKFIEDNDLQFEV